MQASYVQINKGKKIGINEAERFFSRAFLIFCITSLLENLEDTYIKDGFFDSIGKSKFHQLKSLLIDGSYIDSYQLMLGIVSRNSVDEKIDIDQEIRDLVLKYRSDFVGLSEKQKDVVARFLE